MMIDRRAPRRHLAAVALLVGLVVVPVATAAPGHPSAAQPSATPSLSVAQLRAGPFAIDPAGRAPITSSGAELIGPVPPSTSMYFTVSFEPASSSALAYLIDQQSSPSSPLFHHFLSPASFLREFGPSEAVRSETTRYFESFGAVPVPTGSAMTLGFRANATAIQGAFGSPIDVFRLPNGTMGFANARPLSLPVPIARSVSSVDGLISFARAHPTLVRAPFALPSPTAGPIGPSAAPRANMSRVANWSVPGFLYSVAGSVQSDPYQFLAPASLSAAYNATAMYRRNDTGLGTTIAVVMGSGYNPSDIASYSRAAFGSPTEIGGRLTAVPVPGEYGNATLPGARFLTDLDAMEFAIDIEYASTMAPGAWLDAVYGPSLSLASLVSAYARVVSLTPLPNVVTNSWGAPEDTWWNLEGPSWQSARALENYWAELTAMGTTVLAASGDNGGYDPVTGLLSMSLPASSPYVTAVGGTQTTVADGSGSAFPGPSEYIVNQTVALFGWSQARSGPLWFPNESLPASNVSSVQSERYWYDSAGGGAPDYASGGLGLSAWFTQPWWQHGFAVPDSGRRMAPDVSAEADFNETFFFAGAWNFFWGGTSFSCPTVAGEVALLDGFLNDSLGPTSGRSSYYLGALGPLLYALGNDRNLSGRMFTPAGPGSSPWDAAEISQNLTWPGGQNWPVGALNASGIAGPAWNLLVGWGVPDIGTLSRDAPALLQPSLGVRFANGTAAGAAPDGINYTFQVVSLPSGTPVPLANVQLWTVNASLVPGTPWQTSLTASATGTFPYAATGSAFLAIVVGSAGRSAFQSIWFYPGRATSGTLNVSVVDTPATMMGGFAAFNGYGSPTYPATGPIEPNQVVVRVTYRATPSSGPVGVYNAQVEASAPIVENFSSPPQFPNPWYDRTPLAATAGASLSLTNVSGFAYVDTWNVPMPETYVINATFRGLNATTHVVVTPQLNVEGVGPTERFVASHNGTAAGYVGLGARNTLLAPAVLGGASYALPVRVSDWRGSAVAGALVDLALPAYFGPPNQAQPIAGTQTYTNASGVAWFTIDSTISSDAAAFGGNLSVQAFNSSYPAEFLTSPVGPLDLRTNDSDATLRFLGPALINVSFGLFGGAVSTSYVGTSGAVAIFRVVSEAPVAGRFNNITRLSYTIDSGLGIDVPLGSAGQSTYSWLADLPNLPVGAHQFGVTFSDAQGFTFRQTDPFWVIGAGPDPIPAVAFTSPLPGEYLGGSTEIAWNCDQAPYLGSETLTATGAGLGVSWNVTGRSTFKLSLAGFASEPITLRIDVRNVNGVNGSATTQIEVTNEFDPTAQFTSPLNGSVFPSGSNVTVGFTYSGDYLNGATLSVRLPNGTLANVDVTGQHAFTLFFVGEGNYTLGLAVTSADGATASALAYFTVVSTETIVALRVLPTVNSVAPGGTVQLTATPSCAPAPCPAAIGFVWSTSSPTVGALTSVSGGIAVFHAGPSSGTSAIYVTATLGGSTVTSLAFVTVGAPSISTTPPIYESPYLWTGVVALIGLASVALLLRQGRPKSPERHASRGSDNVDGSQQESPRDPAPGELSPGEVPESAAPRPT